MFFLTCLDRPLLVKKVLLQSGQVTEKDIGVVSEEAAIGEIATGVGGDATGVRIESEHVAIMPVESVVLGQKQLCQWKW